MSRHYTKTKGTFYIYDPAAGDYFKGIYKSTAEYTKYQWEARVYKTIQGAKAALEALGSGFIVVDQDGKMCVIE